MATGVTLALGITGCSGVQELHTTSTDTVTTGRATVPNAGGRLATSPTLKALAPLSRRAPARLRDANEAPGVGATQTVTSGGAHLEVTLLRVIDPLQRSGASLLPGTRAVAIMVRIASSGPELYDSSATGDFSLRAASGVVTPVFATHGICRTPLNDFDRYITAGEVRSGCVVFAVPRSAAVRAVRFSPHAAAAGRLTWRPS
jgi:hypothetical protein